MKKVLLFAPILISAVLSIWLMFHTLRYDSSTSEIIVGAKYWSDFGSHIPLIRSYTFSANWPPEHPLFSGESIKYHFLFYGVAGLIESFGVRFDRAVNIGSIGGFITLISLIVLISYRLTRSLFISLVSSFVFLFNSSLTWLEFLQKNSLSHLFTLKDFVAFRPWNDSLIGAFWTWNIYSNQRHLALSFTVVLLLIFILLFRRRGLSLLTGFLIGSLLLLNQAAFLIAAVFCLWLWFFASGVRTRVLISLLGFLPWVFVYLTNVSTPDLNLTQLFDPGFIAPKPLTVSSFSTFWLYNLGPHLLLIPLGFIFAPRKAKLLFLPLLIIFALGNIFRFSPDMFNNHKFFNFFIIIGGIFTASALKKIKPLLIFLPFLFLGGVVDMFPVINDHTYRLTDYPANPDVKFFQDQTPSDSVILNSSWFFHPASLAGRKIFNGYSYFTWSYGYDQVTRENITKSIYAAPTKSIACRLAFQNGLTHIELTPTHEDFLNPSPIWQSEFIPVYTNPISGLNVYDLNQNCTI